MGRGPIPRRPHGGFPVPHLCAGPRIRHYHMFPCAIPDRGAGYPRVTHPSAASVPPEGGPFARLACLRRAASVRSEPGSNSPSWSPRATRRGAIFQIVILSPSIPRTWLDPSYGFPFPSLFVQKTSPLPCGAMTHYPFPHLPVNISSKTFLLFFKITF